MAQQVVEVVVLATKSDYLSSTPRTHNLSSDFHTYAVACIHIHIHNE